ncbi:uncharacterized protein F4822DRAFT_205202 [Hypoxylon trugodes]|uniref:uncharacterized protein n=1 Tax=Hypoxylon trugodes TaxID=326681 RepID=UPI00219740CF|nr:uncharacterized protein F4822DRAFT_205202 [Hypoxylon trugodes]KAI1389571.1 hypothetical protein F4822DRAFT_205202 [Hypoxylon trugodes]
MPVIPWVIRVGDHPGSSAEEIANEPDWDSRHPHHIGFKDENRVAGITHRNDDYDEEISEAKEQWKELKKEKKEGELLNFRDIITHQKDIHLEHPENHPVGWRYVLDASEDWVKNTEEWPANIKRRQKEEEEKAKKDKDSDSKDDPRQEHEWKRSQGQSNQHHAAYSADSDSGYDSGSGKGDEERSDSESQSDKNSTEPKYSPQEQALLKALNHEKEYISKLKANDGKGESPQNRNRTQTSIDEQDQFSPDNWLPRSSDLTRLTGKHPLNAEADLSHLFDAGLITPNELHYVRNHGAVPRLLWEFHKIDIDGGKLVLSMDDLKNNYSPINIPVALACDGNRRKELNMLRKSKGFNWGPGAVSCAYWKGPLLLDVLMSAGIKPDLSGDSGKRLWIHFEGSDKPSEGAYATSIPFEYAMDPTNDVILAYEMNDLPLPPDHGYPVRLMIPGYIGGRCVKWLGKIWISDKENDSYYHIWDNRVLPGFITEKDGEFAETLFQHPDTACNEQNLNSVVVKPAHGEKISLTEARKGHGYRIAGYAYDGGGHEVQRVEVSLDEGDTWLYCIRKFPDFPIRHGKKFWTWLHWHVDVELSHLLRAKSITVRCFNVFKNTQPKQPNWNIMGMMNNCWYIVRPEVVENDDSDVPSILFRHPTEPGTGDGGWMKPSVENQLSAAKQEAGTPQKQFTRQEVEKHDNERDCWIVVDGKVYDATSVLEWHPGGKAAVLGHAGKVHQQTSDEFASIHDDYAFQKLKECAIGVLTDKAMKFVEKTAEDSAKEQVNDKGEDQLVLQRHRWVPVKLVDRQEVSKDTRIYTFGLPDKKTVLGLGTCQHLQIGFHMKDRLLIRSYTPTRPILPARRDTSKSTCDDRNGTNKTDKGERDMRDGDGTFDLTVKTYFPDENQPGGALSNILDCLRIGEPVELRGPTGEILYNGSGRFSIEGQERRFERVSLVLGGSGITPGYSLIARVLLSQDDKTKIRVVDANKTEDDILLRDELDKFEKKSKGQLKVAHVLSHAGDDWTGLKGHVDENIIKENLFGPGEKSVVFLCGPPAMIQKAALPALKDWGYTEDENMFGF